MRIWKNLNLAKREEKRNQKDWSKNLEASS